jgi:hypothetical protein
MRAYARVCGTHVRVCVCVCVCVCVPCVCAQQDEQLIARIKDRIWEESFEHQVRRTCTHTTTTTNAHTRPTPYQKAGHYVAWRLFVTPHVPPACGRVL